MSWPIEQNGQITHGCDREETCMYQTDTGLHSDGTPCGYAEVLDEHD